MTFEETYQPVARSPEGAQSGVSEGLITQNCKRLFAHVADFLRLESVPRVSRGGWHLRIGLCALCALPPGAVSAQNGITDLGGLNGGASSYALGVDASGSVVVGSAGDGAATNAPRAFRWTQTSGLVSLGVLNGGIYSHAFGVNVDGSVVVGSADDRAAAAPGSRAFRWTQSSGLVSLGVLNGGSASSATGVNADGSVVVGYALDGAANYLTRAFRWTQSSGLVSLGVLNGGTYSSAFGVNADGSVVVGYANDGAANYAPRAFRWTQSSGLVSLGVLNGGTTSTAYGVSADGSVVVGAATDGAAGNANRAFRWTQSSGLVSLGVLNGGSASSATGVNADGSVVVGAATDGAAGNANRAFRWTQGSGLQKVEDWLRGAGVEVPLDITERANATNTDGSVVVGYLITGTAFIARVAAVGSGLVTLADVQQSLAVGAQGGAMALSAASTVLNGAHSRPLAGRVVTGRNVFWVAGDWGRDDHGARDGSLGLAEAGFGRNFGPAQLNVSLGQTRAKQNLALNGRAKTDGTYLYGEALIPISGDLWATIGGYTHRGDAELRRGYLNAGLPDASTGNSSLKTWCLRARLDWDKAASLAGAEIAPYVDLTQSRATLATYTETGGGFPARFDARRDKATELRLGVHATHPVSTEARLVGTLEAAHRFEKTGARTTGNLIGLFGFDLAGAANERSWLRAGVGIEARLGEGTASLTLSATTKGDAPNYWLAASWRMAF